MQIAYTKILEIVPKESLGEDHVNVLSLVIERDRGMQIKDITRLTGWDKSAVLNVLKELKSVSIVRSEVINLQTRGYTLTEEA